MISNETGKITIHSVESKITECKKLIDSLSFTSALEIIESIIHELPEEKFYHLKIKTINKYLSYIYDSDNAYVEGSAITNNDELHLYYSFQIDYSAFCLLIKDGLATLDHLIRLRPISSYYYELSMLYYLFGCLEDKYNKQSKLICRETTETTIESNSFLKAADAINTAIKKNPSKANYILKSQIDEKIDQLDDALISVSKALEISNDIETISRKIRILSDCGKYRDAIDIIDKTKCLSKNDSESENLLKKRLELLYKIGEYNELATLLSEEYVTHPSYILVDYLKKLFDLKKYSTLISCLSLDKIKSNILSWIIMWSSVAIDDMSTAKSIMRKIRFNELLIEVNLLCNKKNTNDSEQESKGQNQIDEIRKSELMHNIFSIALLDKISIAYFVELLLTMYCNYDEQIECFFDFYIPDIENLLCFEGYKRDEKKLVICDGQVIVKKDWDYDSLVMLNIIGLGYGQANSSFNKKIADDLINRIHNIDDQRKLDLIREEERDRILSNLSHSIKNMLRAIINPLDNMKTEMPQKAGLINSALKGANLIREIVNAISLSFNTNLDDLIWDIEHPGKEKMSIIDMIKGGLSYSLGNMFDFKYFNNYAANYFPNSISREEYTQITDEWNSKVSSGDLDTIIEFANKYMIDLSIEAEGVKDYFVGNDKSSAIKLMILFQEIIFNAVKYSSYIPRDERFISIKVSLENNAVHIQVKNSYSPKIMVKTTGVGKVIIDNFAKVLNCSPKVTTNNNTYTIDMEFKDMWRKNA